MKKQTKKGFTIVELVIVIALIAILAAVLIPTFSNVINNAHESSDTMMVKNLNTILNAEEVNGNRAENMTEALKQAEEGGYKVDKLTPTSSGDIVWDQASNRFVLINAKKEVVYKDESVTEIASDDLAEAKAYRFWKITNDATKETKGYSLYLADEYKGNKAINAATGIDVGTNEGVAVNYVNDATDATAKNVLLRTNGGTLTVNAEKDTVSHYGAADKVVITAVAGNSYHEFGEVLGTVEVKAGHVQVENGAKVGSIIADKTESAPETKVTAAGGAKVGTVVVNDSAVTVTVASGANVAEVAPGKDNVTVNVTGKEASATVIDTTNTDKFAGGLGTEASPYLIATLEQWMTFAANSNSTDSLAMQKKYFSVTTDLDFANVDEQVQIQYFNGNITFNGHTVKNLQISNKQCKVLAYTYACLFANVETGATISDIQFVIYSPKVDYATKLVAYTNALNNEESEVTLQNVEIDGLVRFSDNNTGVFVYWAGAGTLELKNCINRATIYNNGCTGVFVGRAYLNFAGKQSYCDKLIFENCQNYGTVINSGTAETHILLSNYAMVEQTEVVVKNCVNYGAIVAKNVNLRNGVQNKGLISSSAYSELQVENGKFVITSIDGAERYELTFTFSGAASGGGIASQTFILTESDLNSVDAYEWIDVKDIAGKQVDAIQKYGTTVRTCEGKYVFSDEYGSHVKKQPSVVLVAYGSDNTIISIATYSYAK